MQHGIGSRQDGRRAGDGAGLVTGVIVTHGPRGRSPATPGGAARRRAHAGTPAAAIRDESSACRSHQCPPKPSRSADDALLRLRPTALHCRQPADGTEGRTLPHDASPAAERRRRSRDTVTKQKRRRRSGRPRTGAARADRPARRAPGRFVPAPRPALPAGRDAVRGRHQLRGGRRRRPGRLRRAALPGGRRTARKSGCRWRTHLRDLAHLCARCRTRPEVRFPGAGPGSGSKILLDPYARQVTGTDYDLIAAASHGVETLGKVPLGIVVGGDDDPVPVRRPWVPWAQTVIYEAHVAGLTKLHPDMPAALRGTFKGVAHPAVIDHLKSLSVTTLELLPVQASAAEPGLLASGPRELLGLLHSRATSRRTRRTPPHPGREVAEFIEMVDALHEAGHRGGPRRGLQPHLRGRPRADGRPVLAGPVAAVLLPAGRQGHHRHRQHPERRHAAGGPDGHRLAALLGRRTRRRRLPVRPGVGARPAERRPVRPGLRAAHRDRGRPGAARPAS